MTPKERQEKHRTMLEKKCHIEHIAFDEEGYVSELKAVDKDIEVFDLTKDDGAWQRFNSP